MAKAQHRLGTDPHHLRSTLRQDANLHGLCGTVRTGAHGSQGVIYNEGAIEKASYGKYRSCQKAA